MGTMPWTSKTIVPNRPPPLPLTSGANHQVMPNA